jgi:betaine-aldehyde dehydrogenase
MARGHGRSGLIVHWNAPVALRLRALGPALAAGCTWRSSCPVRPLTNDLMMQAVAATKSLPPGVVDIFTESVVGV